MAKKPPPCPDPDQFVWVNTEEGGYWRRKRGTIKKAGLNEVFAKNAELTRYINDAGNRIMGKLSPYRERLSTGFSWSRLTGLLKKGYNRTGRMDYSELKGFDIQPKYPLERLLPGGYNVSFSEGMVTARIPIGIGTVGHTGKLVTHYFFELIVLSGDAGIDNELRIDSDSSDVYALDGRAADCVLRAHVVKSPWMAWLKLNTIETATPNIVEPAVAGNNYGMKVVAVGV